MTQTSTNLFELDKLARLMATENIIVQHGRVPTAGFDIFNRILLLPIWQNTSKELYHMLVSHEIGHALHTPAAEWEKLAEKESHLFPYCNIIEDARIEKLVKQKYPGTRRDFRIGYQELFKQGFFELDKNPIDKMVLTDRINLHFKIGDIITIPFTSQEKVFLEMVDNVKTWQDVVRVARLLYQQQKSSNPNNNKYSIQKSGSGSGEDQDDGFQLPEGEAGTGTGRNPYSDLGGSAVKNDASYQEPVTNRNMEKNISSRLVDLNAPTFEILTLDTNIDPKEYIIPYQEIIKYCNDVASINTSHKVTSFRYVSRLNNRNNNAVSYLYKEFEMRKAADANKRVKITKTGVLNPTKLHSYKFNEDIFLRNETKEIGKNHGIVMFVDFSGSMISFIKETTEHLYGLVLFCRKAQIPFRVYAFSNSHCGWRQTQNEYMSQRQQRLVSINTPNLVTANLDMNLLELYSNKMNLSELRLMTEYLMYSFSHKNSTPYQCFEMNSTPLDGTIVLAHKIARQFQNETKTQIVSTIFLTDGESSGAAVFNRKINTHKIDRNSILQKKQKVFKVDNSRMGYLTDLLLKSLADEGFHVIGYRIGSDYELSYSISLYSRDSSTTSKVLEEFEKDKAVTLENFRGYQEYHFMKMDSVSDSSKFELENENDLEKLENNFIIENNSRRVSRKILKNIANKISGKVKSA